MQQRTEITIHAKSSERLGELLQHHRHPFIAIVPYVMRPATSDTIDVTDAYLIGLMQRSPPSLLGS